MIKELDRVVLTVDLPEHGLLRGDIGTVVLEHGSNGYEVEFVALDGETVAVVSLSPSEVRAIGPREIAQARPIEAA
jgi:Domain of unknown function (DUF4926)